MFCKIINVFTVTFEQFNTCFILLNPHFLMVVYPKNIKQQQKK